ncbi:MAG TPA: LON peptidase substrate-binding domain-containing protein [Acidimicrobiales bacterium]|nr:LON peptidase substrate-binding domain-containing protein [Acidimicrobiales bacterium]
MTEQPLAMFPLGMVVFPFQTVGLCVFESRYHELLVDVDNEKRFGTCLISKGSEIGGDDERTSVGTVVEIIASQQLSDGQTLLMVEGRGCVQVSRWLDDSPYPRALVADRCCDNVEIESTLLASTTSAVKALRALQSEVYADQCLQKNVELDEDPWIRSWQLCSLTPMSTLDQFKVLSLSNPNDRLRLVAEICCERYGDYQRMLMLGEGFTQPG